MFASMSCRSTWAKEEAQLAVAGVTSSIRACRWWQVNRGVAHAVKAAACLVGRGAASASMLGS